jgi:hypothetical protein
MKTRTTFVDCPAYADKDGAARCGLPAEVEYAYSMASTDGQLVCAKICCPRGHTFNGPLEALGIPRAILDPATA